MKTGESCKRICAGSYIFTVNGRTFALEEMSFEIGQSRKQWNVSEVVAGVRGAPFDSAATLAKAKQWARMASEEKQWAN